MKGIRVRGTSSPGDSCCCSASELSVLDYYAHVLSKLEDEQLQAIINVANGRKLSTDSCYDTFKEIQIHGDVVFAKHVDRLVAHSMHRTSVGQL